MIAHKNHKRSTFVMTLCAMFCVMLVTASGILIANADTAVVDPISTGAAASVSLDAATAQASDIKTTGDALMMGYGGSRELPARSCYDIFQLSSSPSSSPALLVNSPTGIFWIRPSDDVEPFYVYCNDGWTLVESKTAGASVLLGGSDPAAAAASTAASTPSVQDPRNVKLSEDRIDNIRRYSSDWLFTCSQNSAAAFEPHVSTTAAADQEASTVSTSLLDSVDDYIHGKFAAFDPFASVAANAAARRCARVESVQTRDLSCEHCFVTFNLDSSSGLSIINRTDSSSKSCESASSTSSAAAEQVYQCQGIAGWWMKPSSCDNDDKEGCSAVNKECFGIPASNHSNVCNGHGSCVEFNTCRCSYPYAGAECEYTVCNGSPRETKGCTQDNPLSSCKESGLTKTGFYYVTQTADGGASSLTYCTVTSPEDQQDSMITVPADVATDGADGTLLDDSKGKGGSSGSDSDPSNGAGKQKDQKPTESSDVKSASTKDSKSKKSESYETAEESSVAVDPSAKQSLDQQQAKKKKQTVEVAVPRYLYRKYDLRPKVISKNKILFYDAQDLSFYERELKNPIMTVWLLNYRDPEATKGQKKVNYSAKRLFETAWKMNIYLKIVEVHRFDLFSGRPESSDALEVYYDGKKVEKLPDVLMPRLAAKISYFGLSIVRHFEKMGVLVLNGQHSLEVTRDKLFTMQQLRADNFPVPKTMAARFPLNMTLIEYEFKFPVVVKFTSGSQGTGVMLVKDSEHFNEFAAMIDESKPLLIQQFIEGSAGRDIRVIVVGGKAIGAMMRIAKNGWKSNFHLGGYVKPVKLTPSLEWLAIEATRSVGLDIVGVDILVDEKQNVYKICEINSTPGFQGFEMATGVDTAKSMIDFARMRRGLWKEPGVRNAKSVQIDIDAEILLPESPVQEQQQALPAN